MSGGVDSSVAAALLQEQGHDVTGVFIKAWYPDWLSCSWKEERSDAIRVAAQLGISFQTLDLSKEYKQEVIDYMVREYKEGRTPNPDVMCNKHIKFGAFFDWAIDQGAAYVATGHYAQSIEKKGAHVLYAGKDKNKDQSYFLWTLTQQHLSRTLFPVGGLKKRAVRKHAERLGLVTAEKKDSQGLCFLGHVDMREFLKHYIDTEKGDVLDRNGNIIGTHEGAILYTIGQRHGFEVYAQSTEEKPKYVVAKDIQKNTITVASEYTTQKDLGRKTVRLANVNWIGEPLEGKCKGRIRYRQPLQRCVVMGDTVSFKNPQHGVAVGQSIVLYKGKRCLGGGVAENIEK